MPFAQLTPTRWSEQAQRPPAQRPQHAALHPSAPDSNRCPPRVPRATHALARPPRPADAPVLKKHGGAPAPRTRLPLPHAMRPCACTCPSPAPPRSFASPHAERAASVGARACATLRTTGRRAALTTLLPHALARCGAPPVRSPDTAAPAATPVRGNPNSQACRHEPPHLAQGHPAPRPSEQLDSDITVASRRGGSLNWGRRPGRRGAADCAQRGASVWGGPGVGEGCGASSALTLGQADAAVCSSSR